LWKDGLLQRVEVQALTEDDAQVLTDAAVGARTSRDTVHRLWTITEGNPLYLRELVDGERSAGRLTPAGDVWHWRGDPTLTPRLVELLDARIGELDPGLRLIVELLATGEPLGAGMLQRHVDPALLDEAQRRGLVQVHVDGRRCHVRLAHPLFGEAVRAKTSTTRARRLRGTLVRAMQETDVRRADDALRAAVLAVDSDRPADAGLLTKGAVQAAAMWTLPMAERLARAAREAGGGFSAALVLGVALSWQGRGTDAEQAFAAAAVLASTDDELAHASLPRAANMFWTLGRAADGEAMLREARSRVGDTAAGEELDALGTLFTFHRNRSAESAFTAARILASPSATDRAIFLAAVGMSASAAVLGRVDQAQAAVPRGEAAAGGSGETRGMIYALYFGQILALRLAGRLAEARTTVGRLSQDPELAAFPMFGLLLGQTALDEGQLTLATGLLRDTVAGLHGVDPSDWTFITLLDLVRALATAGDAVATRTQLQSAVSLYRESIAFFLPGLELARAWVSAAEGTLSAAVAAARTAARICEESGQPATEVMALHTAVCFGDRGCATRLQHLVAEVAGPRAGLAATHARGVADEDPLLLERVSVDLEETGALVLAADAVAQATVLHRKAGRRKAAAACELRTHELAARCDGAMTPAIRSALRPLALTGREHEIASLVAAGLSNREIAERLVVSVRTVEGHIYRACSRLDVTDRLALGRITQVVKRPNAPPSSHRAAPQQ
jgi:ATP/maltotriose-dependent transcriptional regulator MalT